MREDSHRGVDCVWVGQCAREVAALSMGGLGRHLEAVWLAEEQPEEGQGQECKDSPEWEIVQLQEAHSQPLLLPLHHRMAYHLVETHDATCPHPVERGRVNKGGDGERGGVTMRAVGSGSYSTR